MQRITRFGALAVAIGIGVAALMLLMGGLSTAATTGDVDLIVEMMAPAHVAVSSTYQVRIVYYNLGSTSPPDAWVTATLPEGTQFVTSTNRWDDPLPPDVIDGNALSWYFDSPSCYTPLDANCGHILITLDTDEDLLEGTILTTTAFVSTTAVETDTTNNEGSVVSVIGAMAGSTKQAHTRHVMPGDVLTYTIKLDLAHEPGGQVWKEVTLTDTLPFSHQVRFLGWNGTVTGTMIDGHKLRWQSRVRAGDPPTLQYRLGVEGAVTPGAVITNVAALGWDGQQIQLGPVTTVVTLPHGSLALGPKQGGQVYHRYGVTLTVPRGAVTDTTRFQFRPLFTDTRPISPPGGLLFANRAFELNAYRFGEPVREFSRPLTITMNYTPTDVAGLKSETLRLWTRQGPEGPWAKLGQPARQMSGTLAFNGLTFTTTHLSQFALFGEGEYQTLLPLVTR